LVIKFIIIVPSLLMLSKSSISIRFPYQYPVCISYLLHACHMPRASHSTGFDHTKNCKLFSSSSFCLCSFLNSSLTLSFLRPNTRVNNLINRCVNIREALMGQIFIGLGFILLFWLEFKWSST
jgi:hypothetical protein